MWIFLYKLGRVSVWIVWRKGLFFKTTILINKETYFIQSLYGE